MEVNADQTEALSNLTTSTATECGIQESAENGDDKLADCSGSTLYGEQQKEFSDTPEHLVESEENGENTKSDIDKDDVVQDTKNSDHTALEDRTDEDKNRVRIPGDDKACDPCSFDNETIPASAFCTECIEYLCKTCLRDHKRNKITRSHQVLLDDEMPISKKPFERLKSLGCCKNHPEKEIEYRCADHKEYICSVCESRNHRKCKNVEEIEALVDTGKDRDSAGSLLQTFDKNIDILRQNNEHKVDNIATLGEDLDVVNDTLKGIIKDVSDLLAHTGGESKKEAEHLVAEQQKVLLTSIAKANVLIAEQEDEKKTIRTALTYGSPKQLHLVSQKLSETISDVKARMVNFGGKDHYILRLSANKPDFSSLKLCSLTITHEGSQGAILGSPTDDCSVGSDVVLDDNPKISNASQEPENKKTRTVRTTTAETQTTGDLLGTPLINCSIQFVDKHNIRQMGCQNVCNINGCVYLNDGIVLIDKNNSLLMRLGPDFAFGNMITLREKPLGICSLDNCTVAVILEGKKVQTIRVESFSGNFFLLNTINIALHCRGIWKAGNNVALLMSDKNYDKEISEKDKIEVQVRRVQGGRKVIFVDKFKDSSGNNVKMNDPRCLLFTDENHILIGEKNYLAEFDENGRRERFFKSYKGHRIDDIRAITNDNEGNLYVCGTGSNNVHQISSNNFFVNRVIITDIPKPCCIAFDAHRKRLIVGCQDTDFVYEYQFTD